ncbi:AI-2E family transporter [Patulibacter defluvii]|uniref:AI-2E family transporter n=1 Tax=Patulibacter defluvii TaxID=3095358 RepID=UPI002A758A20|nr:AI-2E family transporter [Patulibacter sp. DM4]
MASSPPPQRVALDQLSVLALRLGLIGLVGYGLLLVWGKLQFVLLPFAVAVLLSALLEPVARTLHEKVRLPRWIAAVLTVLGTIVLVAGILTWIAPDIFSKAEQLVEQVEDGIRQLPNVLHDLGIKDSDIQRFTEQLTKKLEESLGSIGGQLSTGVVSVAQGVASVAASIFLALMMLIYLLIDGGGFWRGALRFVPRERRPAWHRAGQRSWRAVTLYVRSQVLVAAIDGVGIGVGLWILGIDLALPLGVFTFIVAFLPYVGAILAGIAAALVALSTDGVDGMLGAIVVTVIVQQVEGNILYPLLIGRSLRLHPMTVLLGVGAGGALLGIAGAFLATPLIAAVAAGAGWLDEEEHPDGLGHEPPPSPPPDDGSAPAGGW